MNNTLVSSQAVSPPRHLQATRSSFQSSGLAADSVLPCRRLGFVKSLRFYVKYDFIGPFRREACSICSVDNPAAEIRGGPGAIVALGVLKRRSDAFDTSRSPVPEVRPVPSHQGGQQRAQRRACADHRHRRVIASLLAFGTVDNFP